MKKMLNTANVTQVFLDSLKNIVARTAIIPVPASNRFNLTGFSIR